MNNEPLKDALPPLAPEEAELLRTLASNGLEGRSLLLVAGSSGRMALHALRRGAASATILTDNRLTLEEAKQEAGAAGVAVKLVLGRFSEGVLKGSQFDLVCCSLPDCRAAEPLAWLSALIELATQQLVIAVDSPRISLGLPLAWIVRPMKPGRSPRRSVLLSAGALRNFFRYQTTAFEPVTVVKAPNLGRLIASARRRSINRMVVIAGPTSSGKSTLASRLVRDASLRKRFGLDGEWRHVRGRELCDLPCGDPGPLIVEMDLMAVENGDPFAFAKTPQFHIVDCARELRVFTILPMPPIGLFPMTEAEAHRAIQKCGKLGEALVAFYGRLGGGRLIHDLYRSWIEWVRLLNPADMKFIINDYVDFREAPLDALDVRLAKSVATN